MVQILIGIIIGIFIAVVGVGGLLKVVDRGVDVVKEQSRELVK